MSTNEMLAVIDARIAELQEARAVLERVFGSGGGTTSPAGREATRVTRRTSAAATAVRQARPPRAGVPSGRPAEILRLLTAQPSTSCPALATLLKMKTPAVLYHLRKLVDARQVQVHGKGSATTYSVA